MSQRRYFLLQEMIPVEETANMMGRMVRDIFLPLHRYIPATPVGPGRARARNPQDILPNILPSPMITTSQKAAAQNAPTKELQVALGDLFGITFAHGHSEAAEVEARDIKQYSLSQSKAVFEHLLEDTVYAQEAFKLLRECRHHQAYFVTGFMTASSATIKRSAGRRIEYGFNLAVPVSSLSGIPSILDPKIAPRLSADTLNSQEIVLPNECIFAIAYDIIALRRNLDPDAPKFVGHTIQHEGIKRAKAKHLALGKDSGSDEEIEDEEEEDYEEGDWEKVLKPKSAGPEHKAAAESNAQEFEHIGMLDSLA